MIQLESLKTRNMKVLDLSFSFHRILNHLNQSSDERVMPKIRKGVKAVQFELEMADLNSFEKVADSNQDLITHVDSNGN